MTDKEILPYLDELGTENHFNHFPAEWAWAMNTPFQGTKSVVCHLGSVRNPMIISWPSKMKAHQEIRTQYTYVADVVPTILDAIGIEAPLIENGVTQKKMDGKSFLSTLNDSSFPEIHTTEYFEILGKKGVYKDGWWAGFMFSEPCDENQKDTVWKLYDLNKDFSGAHNIVNKNHSKIAELKTFWINQHQLKQQSSNCISDELPIIPNTITNKTHFIYNAVVSGIPESIAPDLKNRDFTITADVNVEENAKGVIFTQGGNTAGWAFYMKEGALYFAHNFMDLERYTFKSNVKVPSGNHQIKAVFKYEGGNEIGKNGTVSLYIDNQKVAHGEILKTTPLCYSLDEGQDIGIDRGTGVDYNYEPPFEFNGTILHLSVDLN